MPEGCVVLALIGTGQEIHTGEEAGIQGWLDAVHSGGKAPEWTFHVPPEISQRFRFETGSLQIADRLDLNITLRSHAAESLHRWVNGLLDEPYVPESELAALASGLQAASFPILLTRDLEWARDYARTRFQGEKDHRYGLLASSKARYLDGRFGITNQFSKSFRAERWFNSNPEENQSCCQLGKTAQEFHCQGLELDLPIVCWGEDFWWQDRWIMREIRKNPLVKDPFAFRKNTYRVLLTRGREGLVIFIPPDDIHMESTAQKLIRCGAVLAETRQQAIQKHMTPQPEPVFLPYSEVESEAFKTALPFVAQLAAGPAGNGFFISSLSECREAQWIRVNPTLAGPNRFIVRAVGDSMEPGIKEGDLLVFEYHRTPRNNGQVVIVNASEIPDLEARSAIKRIWRKGPNWLITSDNPTYAPTALPAEQVQYPILGAFIDKHAPP